MTEKMADKEKSPARGQTAAQLREELLQDEAFAQQWRESEPRRRLSRMLLKMRKAADLSQSELAEKAGWDQAHVARMESATGPWPTTDGIRRYAEACGLVAGYLFGHAEGQAVHIDGAVSFGDSDSDRMLDRIVNADVKVTAD